LLHWESQVRTEFSPTQKRHSAPAGTGVHPSRCPGQVSQVKTGHHNQASSSQAIRSLKTLINPKRKYQIRVFSCAAKYFIGHPSIVNVRIGYNLSIAECYYPRGMAVPCPLLTSALTDRISVPSTSTSFSVDRCLPTSVT
jgi:hypothetical protein